MQFKEYSPKKPSTIAKSNLSSASSFFIYYAKKKN